MVAHKFDRWRGEEAYLVAKGNVRYQENGLGGGALLLLLAQTRMNEGSSPDIRARIYGFILGLR